MSFRDEVDALNTRFLATVKRHDAVGACADAYTEDAVFWPLAAIPCKDEGRSPPPSPAIGTPASCRRGLRP